MKKIEVVTIKSIIISAGFATRMYPLTKDRPKGLLEYKGIPVMTHLVEEISKISEINQISVAVNALFFDQFVTWRSKLPKEYKDRVFICSNTAYTPEERYGAVKDLMHTIFSNHIEHEDLLVVASDYILSNLRDMYDEFAASDKSLVAIVNKRGQVKVNKEGIITDFKEKQKIADTNALPVYMFKKNDLEPIFNYVLQGEGNVDSPGYYIEHLVSLGRKIGTTKSVEAIAIEETKVIKAALESANKQ